MKLFAYINTNIDRVKSEVKAGIMPCSILRHWEIYAKYDYYRKMGYTCMISVAYICDDFRGVKANTVFRIIRKMEAEIENINNSKEPANTGS